MEKFHVFLFFAEKNRKKEPSERRVHPLFVRVSKMAKKSYQKMQPMTAAKEKQLRAAEAAGVAQFYINASIPKHTGGRGPRTVKIKDAQDTAIMAATLLQKMWRGVVAKRGVAAVRVAVAASKKEAAAAAAQLRVKIELQSSWAVLMNGKQLSALAIARGDLMKLCV